MNKYEEYKTLLKSKSCTFPGNLASVFTFIQEAADGIVAMCVFTILMSYGVATEGPGKEMTTPFPRQTPGLSLS